MFLVQKHTKKVRVGMTKDEVIRICGGEWKLKTYLNNRAFLAFTHLKTEFELSHDGKVTRIVEFKL